MLAAAHNKMNLASLRASPSLPAPALRRPALSPAAALRPQQQPQPVQQEERRSVLLPALLAGCLLTGALVPDEALAAKSGGRVGGSSGFKASRTAAPRATENRTVVNNTTVVGAPAMAPPLSPFGFGFPSFGGFSIMPTFVMPFPFFGGLLQFFFLMMIVSVVFNIIRAVASSASNNSNSSGGGKGKDDGWGDL